MTSEIIALILLCLMVEGFFSPIRDIILAFRFPKHDDDTLADPIEPKEDAAGKRDPQPLEEYFAPPILSSTPLHEYKRGHPQNPFCCECGAGEYHAVHSHSTERNKELWDRIQQRGPEGR
jgi:hypothetical protein